MQCIEISEFCKISSVGTVTIIYILHTGVGGSCDVEVKCVGKEQTYVEHWWCTHIKKYTGTSIQVW